VRIVLDLGGALPPDGLPLELLRAALHAAQAPLALALSIDPAPGSVRLSLRLVDGDGEDLLSLQRFVPVGELAGVPRWAAREVLLAAGDESAALPAEDGLAFGLGPLLALCRASRLLDEARPGPGAALASGPAADPGPALAELLSALEAEPGLPGARELLLDEAKGALGGPWMPALFAALERLAEISPDDAEVLRLLGDYRREHGQEDGAREAWLQARALAAESRDPQEELRALERLASLAESRGRAVEAAHFLRQAVQLADDGTLYLRLGLALRTSSPAESLQALRRALALVPGWPQAQLETARTCIALGDPRQAAAEAARAAEQFVADPETSRAATSFLRELYGRR
jgi:tetratricopeptide (TPR) repeat protein